MIKSFSDKTTIKVWLGQYAKKFPSYLVEAAQSKLRMIHVAEDVNQLRSPPGNHLEKLSGDLDGFYSIRINRQWRVIFIWEDNNAYEVEITDYH